MRSFLPLLAVTIVLSTASSSRAQDPSTPTPIDVGDLTSDGAGGWNYLVRPLAPGEMAPSTIEFIATPLEVPLPPATPAQVDVEMLEGRPLTLVIPNSAPLSPAGLEISQVRNGYEIDIHVARSYGNGMDAPADLLGFEYLHPLGPLDAGDYRLNMTFASSYGTAPSTLITGFLNFSVVAIPSPATLTLMLPATAILLLATRRRSRHPEGLALNR